MTMMVGGAVPVEYTPNLLGDSIMICRLPHVLVFLACFASIAEAESVTFRFDAEVTTVDDPFNISPQLPFQLQAGDAISGLVTFTPVGFGQTSGDDASLEIRLHGEKIIGQGYRLATLNDYIAFPGAPVDGLSINCGVPDDCFDSTLLVPINSLFLALGSFQDILPGGAAMDAPEAWNSFDNRRVELVLTDSTGTSRMRIAADVGQMHVVPEPTSAALVACCALVLLRARLTR